MAEIPVLFVTLGNNLAGFDLEDIRLILPCREQPDTRSVIYTSTFPGGVTVDEVCEELILEWSNALCGIDDEDESEDGGEVQDGAISVSDRDSLPDASAGVVRLEACKD